MLFLKNANQVVLANLVIQLEDQKLRKIKHIYHPPI